MDSSIDPDSNAPHFTGGSQYVYVPVPTDRVKDVFLLLSGQHQEQSSADPDLGQVITRIYRESEEQFRRLLRFLADRPGVPVSTLEVAEGLDLYRGTGSLAGMLGAFGRRSTNRYEGFWPFEKLYNAAEERSELIMPPEVAAVVDDLAER